MTTACFDTFMYTSSIQCIIIIGNPLLVCVSRKDYEITNVNAVLHSLGLKRQGRDAK